MGTVSREVQSFLLLVGTIVGVGMFAIPFVFYRAGFLTGAVLLAVLAAATTLVHLAYAEVVAKTKEVHRLPGYVRLYIGRGAGRLSSISYIFGLSGALLAYLVLGGSFLGVLINWALPDAPAYFGPLAFYVIGVAVIFRGIRFESFTDAVLTTGLVAAILVLGFTLLPSVSPANLTGFYPERSWIPYGVLLFSLAGAAIIPDLRRVLGAGASSQLGKVIASGTIGSAILYLVFAIAVVGTTGAAVTPDAISGISSRFGLPYLILGNAIGVLATITSFIALGMVFEGMLVSDFRFKPRPAWLATAAVPAILYGLGFQDFIVIIGVVGALAIGLDSILILLVHRRVEALSIEVGTFRVALPAALRTILIAMFIAGIIAELALGIP